MGLESSDDGRRNRPHHWRTRPWQAVACRQRGPSGPAPRVIDSDQQNGGRSQPCPATRSRWPCGLMPLHCRPRRGRRNHPRGGDKAQPFDHRWRKPFWHWPHVQGDWRVVAGTTICSSDRPTVEFILTRGHLLVGVVMSTCGMRRFRMVAATIRRMHELDSTLAMSAVAHHEAVGCHQTEQQQSQPSQGPSGHAGQLKSSGEVHGGQCGGSWPRLARTQGVASKAVIVWGASALNWKSPLRGRVQGEPREARS